MFALSLGYSILRGIMHSLSLSAALERKKYTQIEKCNRSSFTPTFPLDKLSSNSVSSTQSLPLPFYPKFL